MSYTPSDEILEKYAEVLVNFALGGGTGIKKGDVIYLSAPLSALPFYRVLKKVIIKSGGLSIGGLADDMSGAARYYYENASEKQLSTFLDKYYRGLADQIDHRLAVISDHDAHELDGIDPKKMMLVQKTNKPLSEWLDKKEAEGQHTWTLALYGTPAMAKEAGLTEKEYWNQIIHACYLDYDDPITEWRKISKEVKRVSEALTKMQIKDVHMTGKDVDLKITIGEDRKWLGGSGRNIPSFEIFTSPDWRGTNGWIKFNQPLYRYGSVVKGIELHFENGRVVKATAKENQKLLTEMLATDPGASQIGEYSLTDRRLSRITKFMAETLFDENIGGTYGNTHIAVGKAYKDTYAKSTHHIGDRMWARLGFNDSAIHTDMISTANRKVLATLHDGTQTIIYEDGQFTI